MFVFPRLSLRVVALASAFGALNMGPQVRAEPVNVALPPVALQVRGPLVSKPGVTDLKFAELFKMPVGALGLQASDKLQALVGKRVRMVGYMANAEDPTPGMLVLTPLPVSLGDEDEKLVDDLPPTAVFVHLSPAYAHKSVPNLAGLIRLVGRLELGQQEEADGHASATRLVVDDATSRQLTRVRPRSAEAIAQSPRRVASTFR